VCMSPPVFVIAPLLSHDSAKGTRAAHLSKLVPITQIFFHYMVPRPTCVKAEIGERGSEKTDYRYHCGRLWIEEVGCTLGLVRPPYAGLGMDEKVIPVPSRRRV
jgi:hypothetical protein